MNEQTLCACGCGETTTPTHMGVQRTWRRGHNRRLVGSKGWMQSGYWYVNVRGTKIAFHRYVMEVHLGRKLGPDEIVHHIDHNPLNNDPDNLTLLSRSEHQRLHACSLRRRWTAEEKARALKLRNAGMTIPEIALVLGRPFSSTAQHLAKLTKESRLAADAA